LVSATPTATEVCDACDGSCTIESFAEGSAVHVEGQVEYTNRPPTNGDHADCWAAWEVHESAVDDENWVHNLEHGGVAFLYRCADGCAEEVEALAALHRELPAGRALVTPYDEMEAKFAAVAWSVRLVADCLDVESFRAFFEAHVGQGPEDVTSAPAMECL
jgi:hypothetical protein